MRKINDWENVQEAGEFESIKPGIYPIKILRVEDVTDKEYLLVEFDIVQGEFKGYFTKLAEQFPEQPYRGVAYRSYKATATKFFKAFITAVEKSNKGYHWNWDEKLLIGKFAVAVFGEEEYLNDKNELKVSTKCREIRSVEAYKNNDIKIPAIKRLASGQAPVKPADLPFAPAPAKNDVNPFADLVSDISNDDLPF